MGIHVSRLLQFVCAAVVAVGAALLLIAMHHGSHTGLRDLTYHADQWWNREPIPKAGQPIVHAQPQARYTLFHSEPKKECQECKERVERYRAAELNPQIIVRRVENVLELPRR